jgi:hypothetical protein
MPSTESSRTSHSERGPASSPIRSIRVRSSPKQIAIDSGSVATTASLVIAPSADMMQMVVVSRETSRAAKRGWFSIGNAPLEGQATEYRPIHPQ